MEACNMTGHITVAAQQGTEGTGYMLQADMQAAAAVAEIQPSAFYASGDINPVIHAPYLIGDSTPEDDIRTLIDNNSSSTIGEQLLDISGTAEVGFEDGQQSSSPPTEQWAHPEDSNTHEAHELSCRFCELAFSRHCDLKYV
ncbi:hypothetical protein J4E81_003662 [Alternaria sp. BMP 2799]|nr:hypothetical protein J4E81_003662 [Alternaria sp. BMP 2799]